MTRLSSLHQMQEAIWPLQKDAISIDAIAVDGAADQHPSLAHVLW